MEVALPDLGRWLAVALLVIGGLVLFFLFARDTEPVAEALASRGAAASALASHEARPATAP